MRKRQKPRPSSAEKQRLEREVLRAHENIARLKSFIKSELEPSSGGENGDAADAASSIYEREKALALIRTLEKKLQALEHALEIEVKGTYGICEACGQRISPERLDIVPEATLCVECQAKAERSIGTRKRFSPTPRTKRPPQELE